MRLIWGKVGITDHLPQWPFHSVVVPPDTRKTRKERWGRPAMQICQRYRDLQKWEYQSMRVGNRIWGLTQNLRSSHLQPKSTSLLFWFWVGEGLLVFNHHLVVSLPVGSYCSEFLFGLVEGGNKMIRTQRDRNQLRHAETKSHKLCRGSSTFPGDPEHWAFRNSNFAFLIRRA